MLKLELIYFIFYESYPGKTRTTYIILFSLMLTFLHDGRYKTFIDFFYYPLANEVAMG
jgi:hypothetical protein